MEKELIKDTEPVKKEIVKEKVKIEKEKVKEVLTFNVGKKKLNLEFYKAKFKSAYDVMFIEENENEIIFSGKDTEVILKKI
ncbi:MAG: hypothetical protein PHN69_02420 [Candidatus Pacebacteria bacterium]|nr:hypothetical protein [Candidatus Paceibacterota bacterium]